MKVLKYPLNNNPGKHEFHVPVGSKFLNIAVVNNKPVAYFLVDQNEMVQPYTYHAVWTGKPTDVKFTSEHLGMTELHGLVTHYFKA